MALLALASCSSKQHKAEGLVKDYLEKHLDDPKSYESVKFDTLTPFNSTYDLEEEKYIIIKQSWHYQDCITKYSSERGETDANSMRIQSPTLL